MAGIYSRKIDMVRPLIDSWLRSKLREAGREISEEQLESIVNSLSAIVVLGAEWGEGDALAGMLLMRVNPDTCRRLVELIESLGVKIRLKNTSCHLMAMDLYHELSKLDELSELRKILG